MIDTLCTYLINAILLTIFFGPLFFSLLAVVACIFQVGRRNQ
jgi:hypothetical protein